MSVLLVLPLLACPTTNSMMAADAGGPLDPLFSRYPSRVLPWPLRANAVQSTGIIVEGESFDRELVKVDPTKISACEKRMTSSACPPTFPPDYPGAVARPFADCTFRTGLLTGFVPAGETCVNAQECVAGTVCIKPNGVCRGVCSSSPKQGDPCAFGCGPGLVCGKDGKCAPLKPLDTPCDVSTECETDLICVGGTCRPRR